LIPKPITDRQEGNRKEAKDQRSEVRDRRSEDRRSEDMKVGGMSCTRDTFNNQSTIINHQSKSRGWKLGKRKEEGGKRIRETTDERELIRFAHNLNVGQIVE
jgi:hypothetical protein